MSQQMNYDEELAIDKLHLTSAIREVIKIHLLHHPDRSLTHATLAGERAPVSDWRSRLYQW